MNFSTHNDGRVNINGTSLQGYLEADYQTLKAAVGEPMQCGGPKVKWEWCLQFEDEEIATVYDWKNYHLSEPEQVVTWHIGGFNRNIFERVKKIIADVQKQTA